MQITDTLIAKFLSGKCTTSEAVFVSDYLEKHPAVLEFYLKKNWEEADKAGAVEDIEYDLMLQEIRARIFPHRNSSGHGYIKWLAIAASLLILVGYWSLRNHKNSEDKSVAGAETNTISPVASTSPKWITKINDGKEPMQLTLADNSEVTLSPGASLEYSDGFDEKRRDVYLHGEALFEVSKDAHRPFTVYAALFSTTALGTSFLVTEDDQSCRVKLYTGKVVIKSRHEGIRGWNKDIFLMPGEQMDYDLRDGKMAVRKQKNSNDLAAHQHKANDVLSFTNTDLADVLDRLAKHFDEFIEYDKSETEGKYFTGTVIKTDSLPVILNVIARMNGLVVTKKADGFLIKKSQ